ncbi:hypothetical protein [Aurantimonas sp. Leaf443]|uniref:hypothetical protein n=1 Tax=Aurantimonas sp. Leaf443 TaxID=1736378 RepID=UPI0006F358D0|nr:hypothetical protein [Aurantimonas sp. Leaf443]KQT83400.1 hypothetical protein ASG48_12615 [Aurantimonas sp. Leaf443]
MKSFIAAAALTLLSTAALADELKPMAGTVVDLGAVSGAAYYTVEADGFHLVTTLKSGEEGGAIRFSTVLNDGQTAIVSVPGESGTAAKDLHITRRGDKVEVMRTPDLRAEVVAN